jgi:hypothetical protein
VLQSRHWAKSKQRWIRDGWIDEALGGMSIHMRLDQRGQATARRAARGARGSGPGDVWLRAARGSGPGGAWVCRSCTGSSPAAGSASGGRNQRSIPCYDE